MLDGLEESNSQKISNELTVSEKLMLRISLVFVIIIISLLIFSNKAYKALEESSYLVTKISSQTEEQFSLMDNDLNKIQAKANEYASLIQNVKSLTEIEKDSQKSRIISKDAIPNMLTKIMELIPKQVKIISITNENDTNRILIEAESEKYEQLGYFSSILKTENVLKNIKSSSGFKNGNVVRITIEGELL